MRLYLKLVQTTFGFARILEPRNKHLFEISNGRNMLVAEGFVSCLIKTYDKPSLLTDGST